MLGILAGGYAVGSTYAEHAGAAPTIPQTTAPNVSASYHAISRPTARPGLRPAATPKPSQAVRPTAPAAGWVPNRVVVPTIGVDAPVDQVGTVDGVLVPPDDPSRLGWWHDGAGPGAKRGSVLITGHTVHAGGGALDHLGDLEPGAAIRVQASGQWLTYRVGEVSYYPRRLLAAEAEEVFDQASSHRLVLITCERWDGTAYAGNTIVVAEPVGS